LRMELAHHFLVEQGKIVSDDLVDVTYHGRTALEG